jgi:hypothetical protein
MMGARRHLSAVCIQAQDATPTTWFSHKGAKVRLIPIVLRPPSRLKIGGLTMRTFAVVAALSIALSSCLASAAPSEERLVMPFDCRAIGGDVELVPGPSQSYRIYGTPERQLFTACSPERPELCRSWMLHRFDIDCSGVRVSWLSVVDVLTKWRPNRVWVSDGRLHVRMGPWWKGRRPGRVT